MCVCGVYINIYRLYTKGKKYAQASKCVKKAEPLSFG